MYELPLFREAIKNAFGEQTKLMLILSNKMHNVRFMPININPQARNAREMNISPGTVIDRQVVHSCFAEFYLASSKALQVRIVWLICNFFLSRAHLKSQDTSFCATTPNWSFPTLSRWLMICALDTKLFRCRPVCRLRSTLQRNIRNEVAISTILSQEAVTAWASRNWTSLRLSTRRSCAILAWMLRVCLYPLENLLVIKNYCELRLMLWEQNGFKFGGIFESNQLGMSVSSFFIWKRHLFGVNFGKNKCYWRHESKYPKTNVQFRFFQSGMCSCCFSGGKVIFWGGYFWLFSAEIWVPKVSVAIC